jgi:hypothetical protein
MMSRDLDFSLNVPVFIISRSFVGFISHFSLDCWIVYFPFLFSVQLPEVEWCRRRLSPPVCLVTTTSRHELKIIYFITKLLYKGVFNFK